MTNWKHIGSGTLILFGLLLLVVGILEPLIIPFLFEGKIKEKLPLKNNTEAYERFTRSKVPIQAKVYLFNVTNIQQVQQGSKPIVSQVGPFSFIERRRKEITAIKDKEQTLDYRLYRTWFFDQENSASLNSIINLPNVPIFAALFKGEEKRRNEDSDTSYNVLTGILSNETLYLTNTADAFLFKGMRLPWLDELDNQGLLPDDAPPNNTFGFYYGKNNTWDKESDGTISLSTGVDGNFANIGKVTAWNGKKQLNFWKGDPCNTLRGTDGQFFHPGIKKDEKLDIFAPDLCRTLTIEYVKTTSIRSIELYRFGISPSFFKPIDSTNETKCYCVKRTTAEKEFCKHGGIIDASSCRKKPIIVSTPHFYNGDETLRNNVEGLNPSQVEHDTFIDIEPMTGSVMRARRRLQVNLAMKRYEKMPITDFMKKNTITHPLLYIDQDVMIPDDLAQKFENKLTKKVRLARIFLYAALFSGPIILVAALLFICLDVRSTKNKVRAKKVAQDTGGDYQVVNLKPVKDDGSKQDHN